MLRLLLKAFHIISYRNAIFLKVPVMGKFFHDGYFIIIIL